MGKRDPDRHKGLLKRVERFVARGCGKPLANDRDDITQDVVISLIERLDRVECQLQQWLTDPQQEGGAQLLRSCLREIETFGNRKTLKRLARAVRECLSQVEQRDSDKRLHAPAERLRRRFARFQRMDGAKVFANYYVGKRVYWAILDARKKDRGLPTLPIDPDDDDPANMPGPPTACPAKRLMIRQAIQDCLKKIHRDKRRPCVLALLGHTIPEIARLLELPVRKTETRARRGKELLRKCLIRKGVRR